MSNNNPSINPAINGSLAGTLQFFYQKMQQRIDHMLPAQVIAYDRISNRVQVQILITMITTDGSQVPRAQLSSIPVLQIGGGGFSISCPLSTGDLGWIMANDRDISLFLQSYAQSPPNSFRMNSFADAIFIPDAMKSYNINNENQDYLIIQKNDGSASIQIGKNTETGADEINISAQRVYIDVGETGFLGVNGSIAATGTITPSIPVPPYPP